MALDQAKIKQLRGIGHKLKPIVTVSDNGASDNVINELNRALDDHELIKVKFAIDDRDARRQMVDEVLAATGAIAVQSIGKIVLVYRLAKKTNRKLSNLHRLV